MRIWSVFLIACALVRAQEAEGDYKASRHGGTYMFNYYLPQVSTTTPWAPAWSPDGRWVAVSMYGSIWKVDPKSGTAFEVSYNSKLHSSPDWSPDGKWIVYTADDGGKTIQLESVNVETGATRRLTSDQHLYLDPVFSPDGTKLAYVSTKPKGYFNVYVREIRDGSLAGEEVAITVDKSYGKNRLYFGEWDMHIQPTWTPDGRSIVLVSNQGAALGSGDIWRVPVEANGMVKATRVYQEESLYRSRPDVSIEGKRVLFTSTRGAADQWTHLYIVPIQGGEPYKLTFGDYDDFHPRFSPDGERIAYLSNQEGLPKLFVLETYGGKRSKVEITSFRWRRPMGAVLVRVEDEATGQPAPARIYSVASDGKMYAPQGAYARISSTRMTHRLNDPVFHSDGLFRIEAPVGRMSIEAVKGFEYEPGRRQIEVRAGEVTPVTLRLKPIVDMAASGWYSGSTHVHMNYGGNLHNTLEHMLLMARAEDMDLINVLAANKDSRVFDHQHFVPGGGAHPVSTRAKGPLLVLGEEYRPPFWGHVFFIGLRDHLISPFTAGYQGSALESLYPSNTDMFRKAMEQGAAVGYVHAFGGERDPLKGSLGGAKGFAVDAALGTTHAVEWSSSSRGTLGVWHHALNNDLRVAPVGGEDANTSLHRHTMAGSVRTYAYVGSRFTAENWIDAIKQGRTFFSNGPLVDFRINQQLPGENIHLAAEGGEVTIQARAWSWQPLTRVVIHHNGKVWKEIPLSGDRKTATFEVRHKVAGSGWFALTAEGPQMSLPVEPSYPQAGTNAIRVYVGDRKIRNKESAQYFLAWLDKLRELAAGWKGWGSQQEQDHVFAQIEEARKKYQQLDRESGSNAP
ncbi:MAG TPA: CehA/McbA family metallohydrolase [Bryobacteraceae bacterium]|nr:CehA/McbA family metallohydrolase [Bryobacteraceae bacterium]